MFGASAKQILLNTGILSATDNFVSYNGNPLAQTRVTGSSYIGEVNLLGIGGAQVVYSGNYVLISGGAGGAGTSGFSGLSGYSGITGTSGFSGVSGYSGISGFSGRSGLSGLSGHSGIVGISGFSGLSGFSGISGVSGRSGFSGFSGISGLSAPGTGQFLFRTRISSGVDKQFIPYPVTLDYDAFVINNLRHEYDNAIIACSTSGTTTTGFWAILSNVTLNTGYYLDTHVSNMLGSTGSASTVIINMISGAGASGFSGLSGYSGFSGISGISGDSGFSGKSGLSGFSGYSGLSGFSGYSGISGFSGTTNLITGGSINGQLLIRSGEYFIQGNIAAGTGISITSGAGSLIVNSSFFPITRSYASGWYIQTNQDPNGDSTTTPTLNQLMLHPFPVAGPLSIDRISCGVSAFGTAGSVLRLAIYTDVGGLPGNLYLDGGYITADSNGYKESTIPTTILEPGRMYWIGSVWQSGTPGTLRASALGAGASMVPQLSNVIDPRACVLTVNAIGSNLPSLVTGITNSIVQGPAIKVRVA